MSVRRVKTVCRRKKAGSALSKVYNTIRNFRFPKPLRALRDKISHSLNRQYKQPLMTEEVQSKDPKSTINRISDFIKPKPLFTSPLPRTITKNERRELGPLAEYIVKGRKYSQKGDSINSTIRRNNLYETLGSAATNKIFGFGRKRWQ